MTIFHPDGGPCKWLPCAAECTGLSKLETRRLDVVIGIVDWQPSLYRSVISATAAVKAICLLGFSPNDEMVSALQGRTKPADPAQKIIRDAFKRNLTILADSSWQIDFVKNTVGYPNAGPAFGGINLNMFHRVPRKQNEKKRILFSNDPRPRKGTDTVEAAIEIIKNRYGDSVEFDSYWGRRFSQEELVSFLQRGDIFLDAHRRAGWCNPVAEAIACGAVPVCTDIGAVRDFALHNKTALVVPVDDAEAMAESAIRLLEDNSLRQGLAENGWKTIQRFSYDLIGVELSNSLKTKVFGDVN